MRPRLFIFAKAPLMGRAKTRLAAGVGRVHAQRIFRAMCARIFRNCTDPQWDTQIYMTPDGRAGESFGGLWPDHLPQVPQGGGSLSPRLFRIFSGKGPIIAIGTDAPQVTSRDIAKAFKALQSNDAVFGPASDGGFWLIGMNGPVPAGTFDDIRWSNVKTLDDMKGKVKGRILELRTLTDVDDIEDYRAWRDS